MVWGWAVFCFWNPKAAVLFWREEQEETLPCRVAAVEAGWNWVGRRW